MNKQELINSVADMTGLSKVDSAKAVNATLESISQSMQNKDDVRLVGFGTFSVVHRKATTGRNPRSGEPMNIPASNQPKFKAGKTLKALVN